MSKEKESEIPQANENNSLRGNECYSESNIAELKKRNESFLKKHIFEKKQILKWKKGLKNRTLPMENQPVIVVDILNPPLLSTEDESGSTYFHEPLDIILGFIDEKHDDFIVFHYDSHRFEPYEKKTE